MSSSRSLVVIGGGAAGFFCAVNAARMSPGLKVTILEKTGKLLSKVKVSGGGRCNVTHACFEPDEMSRRYPRGNHFVRKAFHRFFTTETVKWFEERGVKFKTEKDGRMFPVSDSSQTIIDCLMKEAELYGVEIRKGNEVIGLRSEVRSQRSGVGGLKSDEYRFMVELKEQEQLYCDYICIASGGYPKTAMFDWLVSTGHHIEEPVPSLFTFNLPGNPITELMGVSVPFARVRISGSKLEQDGPLLITHWGLSGPAILKLSAWGARELAASNYDFSIRVNWSMEWKEDKLQEEFKQNRVAYAAQKIIGKNSMGLPARLWEFLAKQSGVTPAMRWADLPAVVSNKFILSLTAFECQVKGKTTFKEEFVTAGGIRLNEVDANTMMSKKLPGVFFAGEVLDVDGITGGYNFQHAWTSGWIAANSIAERNR